MGTPALSWVLTVTTETLGERSSPPSGTAASARRLWIHETGLCTGVSQYHQANLQKWGSEICENRRLWMQKKNIKRKQQQIIIQVPAVFPLKVSKSVCLSQGDSCLWGTHSQGAARNIDTSACPYVLPKCGPAVQTSPPAWCWWLSLLKPAFSCEEGA